MKNKALDLTQEILGGRHYPFGYVAEEVREFLVEVLRMDFAGIRDERQDAAYAAQMWLYQRLGLNAPVVGCSDSIEKFRSRIATWNRLFNERGLEFRVAYLEGGANFAKPAKVKAAFAAAGVEMTDSEAESISQTAGQ